jgi:hypothetical protein
MLRQSRLLSFRLWESTDCAITFLAPLSGNTESIFLNDTFLVSLFSNPSLYKAYLGDSTEGDSLVSF